MEPTTLYDAAGGQAGLQRLAEAHHARCLADPELSHPFEGPDLHPEHTTRLAAYWGEVLGGPPAYSGACGDHAHVLRMHAGNGDMTDLGRRFVAAFEQALDDVGLPDQRTRAALVSYLRWSVDDVLAHELVEQVPAHAPVPRWTWSGLQRS